MNANFDQLRHIPIDGGSR